MEGRMYNRKSKASAITAIVASALMFGLMIMLPIVGIQWEEFGMAAIFVIIFVFGAYILIYASALPFAIVALVFGIRMLKQQSRQKLIFHNKSVLIAACVLLPFLALGVGFGINFAFAAKLELIPLFYIILVACAYVASIVTAIVSLVLLKNSPEEIAPPPAEES